MYICLYIGHIYRVHDMHDVYMLAHMDEMYTSVCF